MVEDAIQNNTHIASMGSIKQPAQRIIAAQQRIDIHVVIGMVAMVGC